MDFECHLGKGTGASHFYFNVTNEYIAIDTEQTLTLIPSIICTTIVVQNIFLWWKKSSLTISFRGCLTLSLLYLFALVPLTFIGAFIGEQRERIEHPVRPTQMPRYIPSKRWYQRYAVR